MPKDKLTPTEFINFLMALRDSGLARLIGSYARGTENTGDHLSDIDFFVLRGDEGLKQVIAIFNQHGVKWESGLVGQINTPRNADYMPIPVECGYLFGGFKTRPVKTVKVCGIEFKADTYE